jgi:hypothetical protein
VSRSLLTKAAPAARLSSPKSAARLSSPKSAAALFVSLASAAPAGAAVSFNDIPFWAGSGANRAALVIDFNDAKGPESVVWGFRWDGPATGEDLFRAVVAADPRLYAKRKTFGFGTANLGIGYDANANGFSISDGTSFDPATGIAAGDENHADGATPTDAADHYREGWFTGFFNYYTATASPFGGGGTWAESPVGAGDRVLTDGAWDGLSFAPDFAATFPDEPAAAAVPEPTLGLLAFAGVLAIGACRSRRTRRHA